MKKVRGFVFFAFLAALVLSCSIAMAAAPQVSNAAYGGGSWGPPYDHTVWEPLVSFNLNTNATITAQLYLEGSTTPFNIPQMANGTPATNATVDAGHVVLYWPGVDTTGWHPGPGTVNFTVHIIATNSDGTTEIDYTFDFTYAHDITQHPGYQAAEWMWQNTVCSFGPHFRDYSTATDKWYMFTPVDLSADGVQTFEMVAGGRYVIGQVSVAVEGDQVTVNYKYFNRSDDIINLRDFFTIFGDLSSVTTADPDELESMEYGKAYSIANDLGGDTNVLLFTCNQVNFLNNIDGIVRFYENIPWRAELREKMVELAGITPLAK